MISTLILTLNEEVNLPACLESLRWCDDIVILDSFSTDATTKIAADSGCRISERRFDDYASQRNFGLSEISYKHQWILMLDADERTTVELVMEMKTAIQHCPDAVTLFRMRRRDIFMGRWIRRSGGYPTWFGRLVRVGHVRVEREVNEEYYTDGEIGLLKEHIIHFPFNKGFEAWFEKHNRYSSMEAKVAMDRVSEATRWRGLFERDPQARRKSLKQLVYRLPGRPLVIFIALYIVSGGFLEGRAGFTFCVLRAIYEFMIDCKLRELRLRRAGLPL